ncbi:hypothetical protein C5167_005692 [Papaver somniferum]|uniref:Neprosin PEP catalytic domain-containing protein n=1 Tax=Papaver somniferum TaxID=3469 RepID=A0A4Y7JEG7_PAPSO|nr:hypothetical protein C5167_005692 [Papaver somniferum]
MTKEGELFDCIDIYKQPAFDHPLLKDHKIQEFSSSVLVLWVVTTAVPVMRPAITPGSSLPSSSTSSSNSSLVIDPSANILTRFDCPEGTVPIRRTSKEDLLRAKYFAKSYQLTEHPDFPFADVPGQTVVMRRYHSAAIGHGIHSVINTANPKVGENQYSSAQLWVSNGPPDDINTIQAGWVEAPYLFGDSQTRFFGFFQAKNQSQTYGCYNTLCPGFVQVDSEYTLGTVIPLVSEIGGTQRVLQLDIFRDSEKKWWLIAGSDKRHVGYWPEAILPQMTEFPLFAAWGGLVRSDPNGPMTTPMGQGELPNGDYNRQCSITQIQYIRDDYVYVDVGDYFAFTSRSNVKSDQCYGIEYNGYYNDEERATIIFGGPGGPNC